MRLWTGARKDQEKATDPNLWTAHKYITALPGDCGKTRIPNLNYADSEGQQKARLKEEKGWILVRTFFPDKPKPSKEGSGTITPNSICKADPISREQVTRALQRLRLFKALGPDRIPNIILTKCTDLIESRLWYIFMTILEKRVVLCTSEMLHYNSAHKPGKLRYNVPKAYRPFALLNTMGKVLTSIIAEQLTFYTEKFALLPPLHFSGRPACTTNNAI